MIKPELEFVYEASGDLEPRARSGRPMTAPAESFPSWAAAASKGH
ncbi:hypothetical protein ACFS32_18875 [Novosphingobium pokkalii]